MGAPGPIVHVCVTERINACYLYPDQACEKCGQVRGASPGAFA